jgi:hypothetical protein
MEFRGAVQAGVARRRDLEERRRLMAEQKTQPTDASVRAFLESVEPEAKRRDALALADLMSRLTGMEPVMWGPSIVGYGIYHYKYASGHSARHS